MLFNDHRFRHAVSIAITQANVKRVTKKSDRPSGASIQWTDVPSTIDEVIIGVWKCKHRLSLFTRIRLAAQQFCIDGSVTVEPATEHEYRRLWKASAIMIQEIEKSFKIEKTLKSFFNFIILGVDDVIVDTRLNGTDISISVDLYVAMCVVIYTTCVPGISKKLAKSIAMEDWRRISTTLTENRDGSPLFVNLVRDLASFWCETLTEYEYLSFLSTIKPLLQYVKRDVAAVEKQRRSKEKHNSNSVNGSNDINNTAATTSGIDSSIPLTPRIQRNAPPSAVQGKFTPRSPRQTTPRSFRSPRNAQNTVAMPALMQAARQK
jgi:hypothetical protein